MKRIRSGVDAPVSLVGRGGESVFAVEDVPIVVLRCRFVVSVEGGGGRWERFGRVWGGSIEARQRKHSPVP